MRRTMKRLGTLLLTIAIFNYILFEEIVWESIARPIITYLQELRIVQRAEAHIRRYNRYIVLLLFLLLFLFVELLGIAAGALFLSGNFLFGLLLYLFKIPIAMFTFWLFRITEAKLMKFQWFAYLYHRLIRLIEKMKETEVYRSLKRKIFFYRGWIKERMVKLKKRFFPKRGEFIRRVRHIYSRMKRIFQETPKN
ncbi:MAG: hypothetical protein B6D59_01350 [Campylobacteraceae bacterium 4484_4]|nr:MAG: hypothetical protein B6D59_01350 [Campylobacteraceae bacterium 4484_4]